MRQRSELRTVFIRSCCLCSLATVLGLLLAPTAVTAAPPLSMEREEAFLSAFRDSLAIWHDLPDSIRKEKADILFRPYGVEEIRQICAAGNESERAGRLAQAFVEAKLTGDPFSARELSSLIADRSLGPLCHKELIQYVGKHRSSFDEAEGATLAEAILQLADTSGYPEGIRNQLEVAAAALSKNDDVFERMRSYGSSQSAALQMQGARMMTVSHDPRATALLLDYLDRNLRDRRMPEGKILIEAARKLEGEVYQRMVEFLPLAQSFEDRQSVLQAVAYTQDPRAMGVLLREYGDSLSGVRDSTSSLPRGEERGRYFWLWRCKITSTAK